MISFLFFVVVDGCNPKRIVGERQQGKFSGEEVIIVGRCWWLLIVVGDVVIAAEEQLTAGGRRSGKRIGIFSSFFVPALVMLVSYFGRCVGRIGASVVVHVGAKPGCSGGSDDAGHIRYWAKKWLFGWKNEVVDMEYGKKTIL